MDLYEYAFIYKSGIKRCFYKKLSYGIFDVF